MAASSTLFLDVTSSNSIILLSCSELFPHPVRLENFAPDNACALDDFTFAEHSMGVDGCLAIGYTPAPYLLNFSFQPTAPCIKHLQNIVQATINNEHIYDLEIMVSIPNDHKEYTFYNGSMFLGSLMPGVKKVLDNTNWKFVFASLDIKSI